MASTEPRPNKALPPAPFPLREGEISDGDLARDGINVPQQDDLARPIAHHTYGIASFIDEGPREMQSLHAADQIIDRGGFPAGRAVDLNQVKRVSG